LPSDGSCCLCPPWSAPLPPRIFCPSRRTGAGTFRPKGFVYSTYWASAAEPRMATHSSRKLGDDWLLDSHIGGRVGSCVSGRRTGTKAGSWTYWAAPSCGKTGKRTGCVATDYRYDILTTYVRGPYRFKFGFYHVSSHAGDEFLLKNPGFDRLNYYRDVLVAGVSYYPFPSCGFYSEVGWAFAWRSPTVGVSVRDRLRAGLCHWIRRGAVRSHQCAPARRTGFRRQSGTATRLGLARRVARWVLRAGCTTTTATAPSSRSTPNTNNKSAWDSGTTTDSEWRQRRAIPRAVEDGTFLVDHRLTWRPNGERVAHTLPVGTRALNEPMPTLSVINEHRESGRDSEQNFANRP
jgi:hypothetical protein